MNATERERSFASLRWHAADALRAPWLASTASSGGLAAGVAGLCVAAMMVSALLLDGRSREVFCGAMWCIAITAWWLLIIPNALWLARDATRLRLPKVRRAAHLGVWLHAFISIAMPAACFAGAFGHFLVWLVAFSLAATVWLGFLLLPVWSFWALWLLFIAASRYLARVHLWAGATPSEVAQWLIPPTSFAIAFVALQWRRLVNGAAPAQAGFNSPTIWNLRRQTSGRDLLGRRGGNAEAALARAIPAWRAPVADLRGTGTADPARSIRVALGRALMPVTPASRLRGWVHSFGFLAIVFAGNALNEDSWHAWSQMWVWLLPLMIGMFTITLPAFGFGGAVQRRWQGFHGELPLLAMLPGLGGTRDALLRNLLRACLGRLWSFALLTWVALSAIGILDSSIPLIVYGACAALSGALLGTAMVLGALGGKPLSSSASGVLTVTAMVAVGVSLVLAALHRSRPALLPLLCAATLAALLWLTLRGWRGLQRRPHPFLANAP